MKEVQGRVFPVRRAKAALTEFVASDYGSVTGQKRGGPLRIRALTDSTSG